MYNPTVLVKNLSFKIDQKHIDIPDHVAKRYNRFIISNNRIFVNNYEYIIEKGIWKFSVRSLLTGFFV